MIEEPRSLDAAVGDPVTPASVVATRSPNGPGEATSTSDGSEPDRSGELHEAEEELDLPPGGAGEPGFDRDPSTTRMSGLTKAAVFILSLKEEAATSVLRCLSDEELTLVAGEIARIGVIDKETVGSVMEQFLETREASGIAYEGGLDPVSRLLQSSLPPDRASQLTDLLSSPRDRKRFAFLSHVDAASLVAALEEERPQTIAVVLAQMDSARAADILERLPADLRRQVIPRIASLDGASEECIQLIGQVLRKHTDGMRSSSLGDRGGVKAAAEILRAAEEQGVSSFLDDLREERPELAERVSRHLFDFGDVVRFDDRFLARALRRVELPDLALALKSSDPKLVSKVSKNLSRRGAEELRERSASLGPVRLSDVETARSLVLERILSLDEGVHLSTGNGCEN